MESAPSAQVPWDPSRAGATRIFLRGTLGGSVGDNQRSVRPILPRSPIADNELSVVLEC